MAQRRACALLRLREAVTAIRDYAAEIRRTLKDPARVVRMLNLTKGALRNSQGVSVLCPVHSERTPSCSITVGREGTLSAHCFGCQWQGDLFALVAAVMGLDEKREFRDTMISAAELGGLNEIADELRGGKPASTSRPMPPEPEVGDEREYPPLAEVQQLWANALPVSEVECARVALERRGLQPGPELARAITGALPRWARYQGSSWLQSGHRIALPVFDALGALRSVRAWQVDPGAAGPKRLPPAGHRSGGLVLANDAALRWLRGPSGTLKLVVVEGESDFLSACQLCAGHAIVGIYSGAWTQEFADRVPLGSLATIHTDHDAAGDKYAAQITKTLVGRAHVKRGAP